MELAFTVANLVIAAIMTGILGVWIYFLAYMTKSFRQAPTLESFDRAGASRTPRVSVVLPARNEERYIARCLDSLLAQDYSNFEIIAINDSSTDRTGEIIKEYAARDSRIVHVNAPPKPEAWAGKNWACYQGYLRAKSEVLLFTDADTEHSRSSMSLAVGQMVSQNLDALTAVPKLICNDFWTKITLPALATFLHTRFSPLRVNDPKTKTGYFFGSFFIIKKTTYDFVGMVLDYNEETNIATIQQRNHFKPGQMVEFFGPEIENFTQVVEKIWDEDGNELDAARHPLQIVKIRVDKQVYPYNMMRKNMLQS